MVAAVRESPAAPEDADALVEYVDRAAAMLVNRPG
jgi:hypothetical protein